MQALLGPASSGESDHLVKNYCIRPKFNSADGEFFTSYVLAYARLRCFGIIISGLTPSTEEQRSNHFSG